MTKEIDLYRVHRTNGRIARTEYICTVSAVTISEAVAKFHDVNGTDAIAGTNLVPLNSEMKGQLA